MIPDDLALDALEVSPLGDVKEIRDQISGAERFPLITSSDAHRLDEIGKVSTVFNVAVPTVEEIRKAFHHMDGRSILDGELSFC